jgi:hypothetical protein
MKCRISGEQEGQVKGIVSGTGCEGAQLACGGIKENVLTLFRPIMINSMCID